MIIGVQGVQGSGKSTLVENLCKKNALYDAISFDDFYLSHDTLQKQFYFTREKRWQQRGNPGTHEIKLITSVLRDFKKRSKDIRVPIYDKSVHSGQGDRVGFRHLSNDCNVLFIEGWCLGFVSKGLNDVVDNKVKEYEGIHQFIDALIILKPPHLEIVYEWREEAELSRRNDKKGMSKEQIKKFVDMYMWCYNEYLTDLYDRPPIRLCLTVSLDSSRFPYECTLKHF